MNITLDMYQTIAVAVIVLMAGAFLKKRISFLQKFCIPAPVIGGLLFAILTLVLYMTGVAVIDFDDTLKRKFAWCFSLPQSDFRRISRY